MAETTPNQTTPPAGSTTTKPTVRKHKTLGEYKKVSVQWRESHKTKLEIYVGINGYSIQFKPEIEVELPEAVITFLKEATYEEHFYDEKTKKHNTRPKKKYLVELV